MTVRNVATRIPRTAATNDDGLYQFINLPPGDYEVLVEAKGFAGVTGKVTLTVGQRVELPPITLVVGTVSAEVVIPVPQIETSSSTVSYTTNQRSIADFPVDVRGATGFARLSSTVGRAHDNKVGPAPSSDLNVGGQRGRSTLVQVDGHDFTDNSVNAARSTVSQEAVQEYQVVTNSYAPEFGRATGHH